MDKTFRGLYPLGDDSLLRFSTGEEKCTEGESLSFKAIPYFLPELFRATRLCDPIKSKPLQKGLQELCEEGALQLEALPSASHRIQGRHHL